MAATILTNISFLVNCRSETRLLRGSELAILPCIENAYLVIEDDTIAAFGPMADLGFRDGSHNIDVTGQMVLPAWCDSHTHLVFAGSRESEFVDKIKGLSYAQIAAKGGGILNSAKLLNETDEEHLYKLASKRLQEIAALGNGAE